MPAPRPTRRTGPTAKNSRRDSRRRSRRSRSWRRTFGARKGLWRRRRLSWCSEKKPLRFGGTAGKTDLRLGSRSCRQAHRGSPRERRQAASGLRGDGDHPEDLPAVEAPSRGRTPGNGQARTGLEAEGGGTTEDPRCRERSPYANLPPEQIVPALGDEEVYLAPHRYPSFLRHHGPSPKGRVKTLQEISGENGLSRKRKRGKGGEPPAIPETADTRRGCLTPASRAFPIECGPPSRTAQDQVINPFRGFPR
jgi:hypothetical protein